MNTNKLYEVNEIHPITGYYIPPAGSYGKGKQFYTNRKTRKKKTRAIWS